MLNNNIKESSNKNPVFVFLYAIGSILVVAGHCNNGGINLAFDLFPIYAFHLGLFMFCSGYFYKDKCEENVAKYVWKKFKRLIIPMYIWNFVYGFFVQLTKLKGFSLGKDITAYNLFVAPIINGHQFVYNTCFWFIPSLFLVEVITCCIRKILNKGNLINEYIFYAFYLALGVLGVYLSNKGFNKEWWLLLVRTLYFFPFYGLGILYKRKLEKFDKLNNAVYFTIVILIQLIVIFIEGKRVKFTPSWCNDFTSNLLLPFIVGYLGIAFWLRIAKILEPITKKSKIINTIADNAYSIMAHQFLGFFILKCLYAIGSKFIPLFSNFDWAKFKSDIWYYYCPKNINQFLILYVVMGILVPIGIARILNICKKTIVKFVDNKKMLSKQ